MSQGIKPLPREAETFSSIKDYRQICEGFAQKLGKNVPDWSHAQTANRSHGDDVFQILYTDKSDDFFCSANVDWNHRSMEIKGGLLSQANKKHLAKKSIINDKFSMNDSCALTQNLIGIEEFAGKVCEDERLDPRLENMSQYHSAKLLLQRCNEVQADAVILTAAPNVTSDKIRLIDEVRGDGVYGLLYENPESNFFCEGIVDSLQHGMAIRYGWMHNYNIQEPQEALAMTDACSMTEGLLGKDELAPGGCDDRTESERNWEMYVGVGLSLAFGYIGLRLGYKTAKWALNKQIRMTGLPVYRHLAGAWLAATFFDAAAGLFLDPDDPYRQYGTLAAGVTGLVAPNLVINGATALVPQSIRAGIATRLAANAGKSAWGGLARGAGKGFAGAFLVFGLNYAWRSWITDSDYQSYLNKRVSDQVYEDDSVYDLEWTDAFILPALVKGVRGGCRWLAPDMMNSAITWDNDDLEDKFRAEDIKMSEEAEAFIAQFLPPLLSSDSNKDPQETLALLQNGAIELSKAEAAASALLFESGSTAVIEKYKLSPEEIEALAYKSLLMQVQQAGAWLAFVEADRNKWAQAIFKRDGTIKDGAQFQATINQRFPYTPEPKEYWVDLVDGKKIPAFEAPEEIRPLKP